MAFHGDLRFRSTLALAAAATLAACFPPAPASTERIQREVVVSTDGFGNTTLHLQGRTFRLSTADGGTLNDVEVLVRGTRYTSAHGTLALPGAALAEARSGGRGFFWVFVKDYAPKQVWLGQVDDSIRLTPLARLAVAPEFPRAGGELADARGALKLRMPAGWLSGERANVALSSYVPAPSEAEAALPAERSAFLVRLREKRAVQQAMAGCEAEEQPFPCDVSARLGLLLSVDGTLGTPTRLMAAVDLDALLGGWDGIGPAPWPHPSWSEEAIGQAGAAARILRTFRQIDATKDAGLIRSELAAAYGLTLQGHVLHLPVPLDGGASADGAALVHVTGTHLLGARLELTVVSAASAGFLPAQASVSELVAIAPERASSGGSIISNNGGGIVSNNGGGIISHNGGSLISNNGGTLSGTLRVPFAPSALGAGGTAKYGLLAYTDFLWPDAGRVQARDVAGAAYSAWDALDAASTYALGALAPTPALLVLEGEAGPFRLRTLSPAPGDRALGADLDAATTAVASWVRERLALGLAAPTDLSWAGYAADVVAMRGFLDQAGAGQAVSGTLAQAGTLAEAAFVANAYTPQSLASGVTTLAGSGTVAYVEGVGTGASFSGPGGVAVDPLGNVVVADRDNHRIRRIAPDGTTTLVAGSGLAGWQDGAGATARFNRPEGIAVDAAGVIYVADLLNHRIRRIATDGSVTTLAGTGVAGWFDGAGAVARFNEPHGLAVDAGGNLFVADQNNHRIRRIAPNGLVSTVAGDGTAGFADGTGAAARFNFPEGLAVDGAGNLFVGDTLNHRVRRVDPLGAVTTFAGGAIAGWLDGPSATARFNTPHGVAVDGSGNVYVADAANHRIRRVAGGTVSTYAGDGTAGWLDGTRAAARFNRPGLLGLAPGGRLFVSDINNQRFRQIR